MRLHYAINRFRNWFLFSALVCFQTLNVFGQAAATHYKFIIDNDDTTAVNGSYQVVWWYDYGGGNAGYMSTANYSYSVPGCGTVTLFYDSSAEFYTKAYAQANGWPVANWKCWMMVVGGGGVQAQAIASPWVDDGLQANEFHVSHTKAAASQATNLELMQATVHNNSSSPQIAFYDSPPQGGSSSDPLVRSTALLQPGASVTFSNMVENTPCNPATTNMFPFGIVGLQNSFSAASGGDNGQGGNPESPNTTVPYPNVTNYAAETAQTPGGTNNQQPVSYAMTYTNPGTSFIASPAMFLTTNGSQIDWTSVGGSNANVAVVNEAGFNLLGQKLDTLAADLLQSNGILTRANGQIGATNTAGGGQSNVWVMNWPATYSNGIAGNGAGTNYYGFTNIFNGQTNALTLVEYSNYMSDLYKGTTNETSDVIAKITQGTNLASQLVMSVADQLGYSHDASGLNDDSGGPSVSPEIVVGAPGSQISYIFGSVSGMPLWPGVRSLLKWVVIITLFSLVWKSFIDNIRRMFFVTANAVNLQALDPGGIVGINVTVVLCGLIMAVVVSFIALILPTVTGFVSEAVAAGGTGSSPMSAMAATWAWGFLCQYAPIPYILSSVLCWIGFQVFSDSAAVVCLGIIKALSVG